MNRLRETLNVLMTHGYFCKAAFDVAGFLMLLAWTIVLRSEVCLLLTGIFLLFLVWETDKAWNKEHRAELLRKLGDKSDEVVLLEGKVRQMEEEIGIYKALTTARKDNPIKSNRIVSDKTFAIRLKSFVSEVNVCDPCSEDEQEYLLDVAGRLLKWQTRTVRKDSEEYRYLERIGLMPEPSPNLQEHEEAASNPKRRKKVKRKTKTQQDENKD